MIARPRTDSMRSDFHRESGDIRIGSRNELLERKRKSYRRQERADSRCHPEGERCPKQKQRPPIGKQMRPWIRQSKV